MRMHASHAHIPFVFLYLCVGWVGAVLPACSDSSESADSGSSRTVGDAAVESDGMTDPPDVETPDADSVVDARPDTLATGDSGGVSQEEQYCNALASHGTCPGVNPSTCTTYERCLYGHQLSAPALSAYATCFAAPSCKDTETCASEAGLAVGGVAAQSYANNCSQKRNACNDVFGSNLCSPALYTFSDPSIVTDAKACIAMACGDVQNCFSGILLKLGAKCPPL